MSAATEARAASYEESPREASMRVGRLKGRFDRLRVDFPPHTDAVEAIDCIRIEALDRPAGASCGGGFLVAPTGVGKSETLKMAERIINEDAAEGRVPALRVNFSPTGTTESLPQSILAALRVRRPDAGNEKTQWQRAVEEMRRTGVEILMLDEFNRAARRPTMTAAIAISIQEWIMDPGVCPVVIVGSEKASSVLRTAPAVHERLADQIDMQPLDWLRDADKELTAEFLADLDDAIRHEGLLPALSGLSKGDIPEALCRASAGKLRAIVNTVRIALSRALVRGAPAMTREDLAEGVDRYCRRLRLIGYNPFHSTGGFERNQILGSTVEPIADDDGTRSRPSTVLDDRDDEE